MVNSFDILLFLVGISACAAKWSDPIGSVPYYTSIVYPTSYTDKLTGMTHVIFTDTFLIYYNFQLNGVTRTPIELSNTTSYDEYHLITGANNGKDIFILANVYESSSADYDLFVYESNDNGANWKAPVKPRSNQLNDPYFRDPLHLYCTTAGRLILFYQRNHHDIYMTMRPPNSILWSDEKFINSEFFTVPYLLYRNANDYTLILAGLIYHDGGYAFTVKLMESADYGISWKNYTAPSLPDCYARGLAFSDSPFPNTAFLVTSCISGRQRTILYKYTPGGIFTASELNLIESFNEVKTQLELMYVKGNPHLEYHIPTYQNLILWDIPVNNLDRLKSLGSAGVVSRTPACMTVYRESITVVFNNASGPRKPGFVYARVYEFDNFGDGNATSINLY